MQNKQCPNCKGTDIAEWVFGLPTQEFLEEWDKDEVKKKFSTIPEQFSAIDVLVNNAGLALGLESSAEADLDDWDQMVDTNIKGLIYFPSGQSLTFRSRPKHKPKVYKYIIHVCMHTGLSMGISTMLSMCVQ